MSLKIFLNRMYDTSKHTLRILTVRLRMFSVILGKFMLAGSSSSSKSYVSQSWMKYEMNDGRMNYIVLISYGFIFRQLYTENSLSFDISESIDAFLLLIKNYLTWDFRNTISRNFSISCTSSVSCNCSSYMNCQQTAYFTFLKICEHNIS